MSALQNAREKIEEFKNTSGIPLHLGNIGLTSEDLKVLIPELKALKHLKELDLSTNLLEPLPEAIGELTGLLNLNLDYNGLRSLPDEIGDLEHLKVLSVVGNRLGNLPEGMLDLGELEELDLSRNELESLPRDFGDLASLVTLCLDNNRLTELPDSIVTLDDVGGLDLENNLLVGLPEDIGSMESLVSLNLGGNSLQTLPSSIGRLHLLYELNLISNRLVDTLPDTLAQLPHLQSLNISDNPLSPGQRAWLAANIHEDVLAMNLIPGDVLSSHTEVLNQLYPNRAAAIEDALGDLSSQMFKRGDDFHITETNGSIRIVLAEQVVGKRILKDFLQRVPIKSAFDQEVFVPVARELFNRLLVEGNSTQDIDGQIAQMATTVGNCSTPVKDFLLQEYVNLQLKGGRPVSKRARTMIERQAFEKEILKKIGSQLDPHEKIEQVQGLVDSIFLAGAEDLDCNKIKIKGERERLPSKSASPEFAFNAVQESVVRSFVEFCCAMDLETNAPKVENGLFVLDPMKYEMITVPYLTEVGLLVKTASDKDIQKQLATYEAQLNEHFGSIDLGSLVGIPEVDTFFNALARHQMILGQQLRNSAPKDFEAVATNYLNTMKSQSAVLAQTYHQKIPASPLPNSEGVSQEVMPSHIASATKTSASAAAAMPNSDQAPERGLSAFMIPQVAASAKRRQSSSSSEEEGTSKKRADKKKKAMKTPFRN